MIQYRDWYIWTQGQVVARQFDHMTRSLEVVGELPEGWEWTVIVRVGEYMDYLPLTPTQTGASITLTAQQLALPGMYSIQLRGKQGELVRHTNVLSVYVPASLSGDANWPEIPSEFTRLEQRVLAVGEQAAEAAKQAEAAATQIAGAVETAEQAKVEAGRCAVAAGERAAGANASEQAAQEHRVRAEAAAALAGSYTSHPPVVGENGNWWTWNGVQYADSGKPSRGELTRAQGNTLYANALKGAASGTVVNLDDVSPLEHSMKVRVSGVPDPTAVTVYQYGKNLCSTASITTAEILSGAIYMAPAQYPYLQSSGGRTFTFSADVTVYPDDTANIMFFDFAVEYADGTVTQSRIFVTEGAAAEDLRDGVARHYSVSVQVDPGKTLKTLVLKPLNYTSATGARNAKAENIQVELGDTATAYEPYIPFVTYQPGEDGTCDVTSIAPTMALYTNTMGANIECEYNRDTCKAVQQLQQACQDVFPYADYGMPIVYFEGNTTAMSKDNEVNLSYRYGQREGTCTLKWQGSSSLAYPKKNYTVVFDNAFEAKSGWGAQKKYCLKANYIDFSHARNICSARIWASIVKKRPDGYFGKVTIPATPNYGAVDGFACMVVINGEYQGLYTFNIPKDGWMLGMGSGTREAILCAKGGQSSYLAPTFFSKTATTLDSDFDLEYVSDENDADWVLTSLNNMISACINCDGTDYETLMQYVDISSAIDYMIFIVATKAHDCYGKNFILATYDGVKWFFSAYDLDSTWGLNWDGKSFLPAYQTDGTDADTFSKTAKNNKLFNIIWNNVTLKNELLTRWNRFAHASSLWQGDYPLMSANVENVFTNFAKDIPKAVLDEETQLWKGIPSTSVNNVHQILQWYKERVERVDMELGV